MTSWRKITTNAAVALSMAGLLTAGISSSAMAQQGTRLKGQNAEAIPVGEVGINPEDRNGLIEGPYNITVTDNKGCTITHSATITDHTALQTSSTATSVS